MRIIGGHDYYDSGLAYGQDDSILFLRTGDRCLHDHQMHNELHFPRIVCSGRITVEADDTRHRPIRPDYFSHRDAFHDFSLGRVKFTVQIGTVILCGVLYHGLLIKESDQLAWSQLPEQRWIWSYEALKAFADEKGLLIIPGRSGMTTTFAPVGAANRQVDVAVQSIEEWFAPKPLIGACRDAILDQRITIITNDPENPGPYGQANYRHSRLSWKIDQPTLGLMGFAKAVDPYTAFQEISMWKSGVLPSDGPAIVEITDDKVKIAKHGFHHPTSFRKAKQQ